MSLYTLPSASSLERYANATDDYMRPNVLPYAVVVEKYLFDEQCAEISEVIGRVKPYEFRGCGAVTRECPRPLDSVLDPIVELAKQINDAFWKYDLDPDGGAWMQTYSAGGNYQLHTDGSPGQTRKLTAVAMLTDPKEYVGGNLQLMEVEKSHDVNQDRGTIVVFQPWTLHRVTDLKSGIRQTINLGFWGPPFR